jgi:flagellar basal-body rod modification protein FlgD
MINPLDSAGLEGIGLRTTNQLQEAVAQSKERLGQDDFLKLMVAQLRNQDPMKPMENGDFLGQIAQFGTVSGIEDLQSSFRDLAASLVSNQALQASSLVGHSVLASTGRAPLAAGATIRGVVELPTASPLVALKVFDSSGQLVRRMDLGSQAAGTVPFQWDGLRDDGQFAVPGTYFLSAEAEVGGQNEAVETLLENRVSAVTLGQGGGLVLDLEGIGPLDFSEIRQIM